MIKVSIDRDKVTKYAVAKAGIKNLDTFGVISKVVKVGFYLMLFASGWYANELFVYLSK